MQPIDLIVNGSNVSLSLNRETPLLDVLRKKFGCGLEQCGCCMVLVDGRPQKSWGDPLSAVAGKESSRSRVWAVRTGPIRCSKPFSTNKPANAGIVYPVI
jgi:2Fe-2S iron-sulfur cluster binding domain